MPSAAENQGSVTCHVKDEAIAISCLHILPLVFLLLKLKGSEGKIKEVPGGRQQSCSIFVLVFIPGGQMIRKAFFKIKLY